MKRIWSKTPVKFAQISIEVPSQKSTGLPVPIHSPTPRHQPFFWLTKRFTSRLALNGCQEAQWHQKRPTFLQRYCKKTLRMEFEPKSLVVTWGWSMLELHVTTGFWKIEAFLTLGWGYAWLGCKFIVHYIVYYIVLYGICISTKIQQHFRCTSATFQPFQV